jgi:hypothetical protein
MLEKNDLEYLIRHLSKNNVVLFLGAGFSTDANNAKGEKLPDSRELARVLWQYHGYQAEYDGTPLGVLYQAALTRPGGTSPLFDLLRSKLWVTSCPDWYRLMTKWYWYRIYTTNVDNLVEHVYENYNAPARLQTVIAPSEFQDRDAFLRTIQLIKLHGSLDHTELGLTFALKEYGRRAAGQDAWYDHFVRDFSSYPTVLVGTQLDEPLFWQYVAVRQGRVKKVNKSRPKSFLICPRISKAQQQVLTEFNIAAVEATAKEFFETLLADPGSVPSREDVLRGVDPTLEDLFELQRAGVHGPEIRLAERFFSVFRPVKHLVSGRIYRSHFLLGSSPSWEDIGAGLDAEREINGNVLGLVRQALLSTRDSTRVIIMSGPAGSGKTTIAKRVSALAASEGFGVYFAEKEGRPVPQEVTGYLKFLDRRALLVFDEATDDLRLIRDLVVQCEDLRVKPVMFLTARTNDLAVKRYLLQGIGKPDELRVPDLSDSDIHAILVTLEQQGLLGQLRGLGYDQRVQVFKHKAKKQILVAMREATRGRGFDEIIEEEFKTIVPEEAQLLYLIAAIPSMHHYTIKRGDLIAAMELSPSETSSLIEENLSGVLIEYENDAQRLQIRHPLIAEHVVVEAAPRVFLAEAYVRYLELVAHDLPPVRERRRSRLFRIYRDVINHRELHSVFLGQRDLCRGIYESMRCHFMEDGHYWLQYGSYELEYGDLDFAENYLLQAEALMPAHPWVATAIGYLLMRKAIEGQSLMAAMELVAQGLQKLRGQILRIGLEDPYPYHVLGSQMLAFIKRWCPVRDQAAELRKLHMEVSEGCKRHPLDGQLRVLVDDIKRTELETVSAPGRQSS